MRTPVASAERNPVCLIVFPTSIDDSLHGGFTRFVRVSSLATVPFTYSKERLTIGDLWATALSPPGSARSRPAGCPSAAEPVGLVARLNRLTRPRTAIRAAASLTAASTGTGVGTPGVCQVPFASLSSWALRPSFGSAPMGPRGPGGSGPRWTSWRRGYGLRSVLSDAPDPPLVLDAFGRKSTWGGE